MFNITLRLKIDLGISSWDPELLNSGKVTIVLFTYFHVFQNIIVMTGSLLTIVSIVVLSGEGTVFLNDDSIYEEVECA